MKGKVLPLHLLTLLSGYKTGIKDSIVANISEIDHDLIEPEWMETFYKLYVTSHVIGRADDVIKKQGLNVGQGQNFFSM